MITIMKTTMNMFLQQTTFLVTLLDIKMSLPTIVMILVELYSLLFYIVAMEFLSHLCV